MKAKASEVPAVIYMKMDNFLGVQAKLQPAKVRRSQFRMFALLPVDIGKSSTLIISILKIMESVKEKLKREYKNTSIFIKYFYRNHNPFK